MTSTDTTSPTDASARPSMGVRAVDALAVLRTRTASCLLSLVGDPVGLIATIGARRDPNTVHHRIRGRGPLSRSLNGSYVLSSHSSCQQVLRDPRVGVLHADGSSPTANRFEPPGGALFGSFLYLDGLDHARLRRLAAPAFRPAVIRDYASTIEATAHRLLDSCETVASFDLIADFAAPLPIAVISDLLGVPEADRARFAAVGNTIAAALDGVSSRAQQQRLADTEDVLGELFDRLAAQRRAHPGTDVISRLVTARDAGDITGHDLRATCLLLLVAGFETTVNLIGNAAVALTDGDGQPWNRLVADPTLAEAAVEETLRFAPPVQFTARVAHESLELAGRSLRAGAHLWLDLAAANRDPSVFVDPDRFDLDRGDAAEHLAFGSGAHYCLGAGLARLEGAVALRVLSERLPQLTLHAGPRRGGTTIHGYQRITARSR